MSISSYRAVENQTDSPHQLSIRAIRSVLLYCQDWDDRSLALHQRQQSATAGQTLCEAMLQNMVPDLPDAESDLLYTILLGTARDLALCQFDERKSLIDNERAMIKLIDVLAKK